MTKIALALLLAVFALPPPLAGTARARAQEGTAPRELDALAWLAGHWREEIERGFTEELWLPPRGGLLLGLNRSSSGPGRAHFEFLRIVEDEHGIAYLASPAGAPPTPFRLTALDAQHVVFENPGHDFPKRIEYRLEDGKLVASIAGDGGKGRTWTLARVGPVDQPPAAAPVRGPR
jgi:hypothetical protein